MFRITIIDTLNNKPVPSAEVKVFEADEVEVGSGTTDENGHCHFSHNFKLPARVSINAVRNRLLLTETEVKFDFRLKSNSNHKVVLDFLEPLNSSTFEVD